MKGRKIVSLQLKLKVKTCFYLFLGVIDEITKSNICVNQEGALVFHEVSDIPSKISYINKTNTTVEQFTDLVNEYKHTKWMKKLRIRFTFDDGFKLSDEVLDILEAAKVESIFFVNSSTIDSKINLDAIRFIGDFWVQRYMTREGVAFDSTKEIEEVIREVMKVNQIFELQGVYFNWEDLRALQERHFTIGDHFTYHIDVTKFELPLLHALISGNERRLRQERIHCSSFAFPYGKTNRDVVELLEQLKIAYRYGGSAFSILKQRSDCIPRVQVTEATRSIRAIRGELLFNRIIQLFV